jgi:glycosyltransferase involved in cell wall biosynthesis
MKIAWFTPFCKSSSIGQYSAVILDELSKEHDVVVFATGLRRWQRSHRPQLPTVRINGRGGSPDLCQQLRAFDVAVYNLGDHSRYHADIWRTQIAHPGVAIVHDVATWNLAAGALLHSHNGTPAWLAEVEYSHGPAAREWATALSAGEASRVDTQEASLFYNMARSCVRNALAVVVHGEWARRTLSSLVSAPVVHIDFPAHLAPQKPLATPPEGDKVRFLTIGVVNPNKACDLVIESIAGSELLRCQAEYTIAGGLSNHAYVRNLRQLIRQHRLEKAVRFVNRPDDRTLQRLIEESHVLVNLRYPHLGECSGSLQEALFQGRPAVVWGHGYYAEFPRDAVVRVGSLAQLAAALERLAASPGERRARGERALEHARGRFCTRRYCRELLPLLEGCCRAAPACRLADRLARRLADCRPDRPTDALAARLAREVHILSGPPSAAFPGARAA